MGNMGNSWQVLREMISRTWAKAQLARAGLGKSIIIGASTLHLLWAGLLVGSSSAQNSTPVSILVQICGGRYRTAAMLGLIAVTALSYPFVKRVGRYAFTFMLIPQQIALLLSAGAGIHAVVVGHYADGVTRSSAFILGDQSFAIMVAILYTVAVVEAAWHDHRLVI